MSSIRLHPKHGLNPTVCTCFFCGKGTNEIALLGAAFKGEAPRHMVMNYDPCDACKAGMAKGITLIECDEHPFDSRPAIQEGAYPTGAWCVITEDTARRLFQPDSIVEAVLKHRTAFVEVGLLTKLGIHREAASG